MISRQGHLCGGDDADAGWAGDHGFGGGSDGGHGGMCAGIAAGGARWGRSWSTAGGAADSKDTHDGYSARAERAAALPGGVAQLLRERRRLVDGPRLLD